jgi:hypothetical protein
MGINHTYNFFRTDNAMSYQKNGGFITAIGNIKIHQIALDGEEILFGHGANDFLINLKKDNLVIEDKTYQPGQHKEAYDHLMKLFY